MIVSKSQLVSLVFMLGVVLPIVMGYVVWGVNELLDGQAQAGIVCGDLEAWTLHPHRG